MLCFPFPNRHYHMGIEAFGRMTVHLKHLGRMTLPIGKDLPTYRHTHLGRTYSHKKCDVIKITNHRLSNT